MARSAEDCAYLMNVMAGHDAKTQHQWIKMLMTMWQT